MKKKSLIIILSILSFVTIFNNCKRDDIILNDPQNILRPWNIALPLFNAHIQATDLLSKLDSNSLIKVRDDGVIYIEMDTAYSVGIDEIIKFDKMEVENTYDIFSSVKAQSFESTYIDTIPVAIIEDQDFDSILIRSAIAEIDLNFPDGLTGTYSITIPEVILESGKVMEFAGAIGENGVQTIALDASTMRLIKNDLGTSSFTLVSKYIVDQPVGIPSSTQLSFKFRILDFIPGRMWGYFGTQNVLNLEETIDIDLFSDLNLVDVVELKEFNVVLDIKNYFGIPFIISFDSLVFNRTEPQDEVIVDMGENNEIIVSPGIYGTPVAPSSDSISINTENSNIIDAINLFPDKIFYKVSANINPQGPTEKNFLINNTKEKFFLNTKIQVPFWFRSDNYRRTDTIGFIIRDIVEKEENLDYVEHLTLFFDFENGFPFSLSSQAYLATEDDVVVDSLFKFENATDESYDGAGRKIIWKASSGSTPGITDVEVVLDSETVKTMHKENVTKILLSTRLTTGSLEDPEFVKLTKDNYIKMDVAFELKSQTIKSE